MTHVQFIRPSPPFGFSDIKAEYADLLVDGQVYAVDRVEVRSWHTKIYLKGFDVPFNSAWFQNAETLTPGEIMELGNYAFKTGQCPAPLTRERFDELKALYLQVTKDTLS